MLRALRILAIGEGISYLLFAVTMPLKYYYDLPEPNYVVGMAHGVLFMAYVVIVALVAYRYRWTFMNTLWSFLASIIPGGTFYADYRIFAPEARRQAELEA
jgi:integral membrane protein